MSDSVRPHRWQPTRLPPPWDSPGKNTGVGCHFLLQHMKVKTESEVAQSCLTLSTPMDCSSPGSSIHGIFQARVLPRNISGVGLAHVSLSSSKIRGEPQHDLEKPETIPSTAMLQLRLLKHSSGQLGNVRGLNTPS